MHLHRFGRPGNPAVVLVHGIPGSSSSWTAVVEGLGDSFDVLVPDLLGFGESPRSADLLAPAQAAALEAALAREEVRRATFVGHDFGGPVVMSLYDRSPAIFGAMALIATNVFPDTPVPFPLSMVKTPILGGWAARALFSGAALRQMLRRYGGEALGNPASVREIFTQSLSRLDELYRDYPSILGRVDVPVSVVWADGDPFFSLEQGRRTAALVPGCDLIVVERGGHFLPEQRPETLVAAIRQLTSRARL